MRKRISPGAIVLAVLFVLLVLLMANQPKEIDWNRDYTSQKNIPYGGEVTYRFFESMNAEKIQTVTVPVFTQLNNEYFSGRNYLFFNSVFDADEYDVEELLRFTAQGNVVFISAYQFSSFIQDTLDFGVEDIANVLITKDTTGKNIGEIEDLAENPAINFVNPNLRAKQDYVFRKCALNYCFTSFDTAKATVLGKNDAGKVNFIRMPFGKGEFFLHTVPDVFINYHAADKSTAPYIFKTFSYLPLRETFWDDYYKDGFKLEGEMRSVLFSYESLRVAYAILAAVTLLGFFFSIKRRQRIIPVIKPVSNTTLEFVEVVGTLYYHQRNTRDITHKKITYFLETIRTRFHVKTTIFDEEFIRKIAALSGVDEMKVKNLFYEIARLQAEGSRSETDLKLIEDLMWEFNSGSKR
ncbi:MAG: hypothetical protein FD123_1975 [Bacteroidetes bacterium]|nr:MAG: hypothetical protein FD123_1975 [Bacteroidota bacterium]